MTEINLDVDRLYSDFESAEENGLDSLKDFVGKLAQKRKNFSRTSLPCTNELNL